MEPNFRLGAVSQPSTPNFPYHLAQQLSDSYFEPLAQPIRYSRLSESASFPFDQSDLSMQAMSSVRESPSSHADSPFAAQSSATEDLWAGSMPLYNMRRPSSTDRAVASFLAQAERLRREDTLSAGLPGISELPPVNRRESSWQTPGHLQVPSYFDHLSATPMQSSGSSPSSRTSGGGSRASGASSTSSSISAGPPHQGLTTLSPHFEPMGTAPLDENLEINLGNFLPSTGSFTTMQGRTNDLSPWESDPGGPFSDASSSNLSASLLEGRRSSLPPPSSFLPLPSDVNALQGLAFDGESAVIDSGSTVQHEEQASGGGYFEGSNQF